MSDDVTDDTCPTDTVYIINWTLINSRLQERGLALTDVFTLPRTDLLEILRGAVTMAEDVDG